MKRQFFPIVLWIEAVLLLLIVLLGGEATQWQAGLLSFPFAQIGAGLRALSLSGAIGNSIAVVLYLLLSLVPVGILVWRSRRRRLVPEDSLLVGLSLFLFVMFYVMINPGEIPLLLTGDGEVLAAQKAVGQSLFGGSAYAILLAYLVLRLLRRFRGADRQRLQDDLKILLRGLAVCLVFVIFGLSFSAFWSARTAVDGLVFLAFLRWVGEMMPYLLDVVVILTVLELLQAMKADRYGEETMRQAHRVSRLCTGSLAACLVTTVVLNLLQLLFLNQLADVSIQVVFPLFGIAFLLGVLLVVKFLEENRALKADNDLFI